MSLPCLGSFHLFIFPFWHKCLCKVTEKEVYNLFKCFTGLRKYREAPARRGVLPDIPIHVGTPSISQKPTRHCSGVWISDGSCIVLGSPTRNLMPSKTSQKEASASVRVNHSSSTSPCEIRKPWQKNLTIIEAQVSKEKVCLCLDKRGHELSPKFELLS